MRYQRNNLSYLGSHDEGEATHPEIRRSAAQAGAYQAAINQAGERRSAQQKPDVADGYFTHSTMQDHFYLAPNVRFTRTPEIEIEKRRSPQSENAPQQPEGKTENPPSAPPPVSKANSPTAPSSPKPPVSHAVPVTGQPLPKAAQPQVRNAAGRPEAPAAKIDRLPAPRLLVATAQVPPSSTPIARPQIAAQRALPSSSPAPAGSAGRKAAPWTLLSDHVFFELLPMVAVGERPQAPVPAPPPVASAPVASSPTTRAADGVEIRSLYRVIDCNAPQVTSALPAAEAPPAPTETVGEQAGARAADTMKEAEATAAKEVQLAEAAHASLPEEAPATPVGESQPVAEPARKVEVTMPPLPVRSPSARQFAVGGSPIVVDGYEFPSVELLQEPPLGQGFYMSQERLEQSADLLESVLEDFNVRGEIIHVRPGPVVTLYEFAPAPGIKSSRVIGLADDIARSMSAISARVAVIPGRNVIGIELPNETRETVYLRGLIESDDFASSSCKLALCLGKTIGGEAVIADLAKMPHLLVAGTTGSGKSVAINTMILSLLYRLRPEECRLIMVDPKMLELSVYDGIPHLLTPVVTDPKKAVTALKWAVREMEDRYPKMARLGVRNIDGYNQRAAVARETGERVFMQVQTGFEKGTGAPLFEEQEIDLAPLPYIVVIVDEMADLMMVAGKEIEGAIQRLAQMARAAGIHLIMATQRPSVDVITGTIKANFPTRISFQVTSKIDSRTILGEQGAEQLLGQGDMLHMAGGGRIARVHGPFVSDAEVELVVAHLKAQGRPEYLETVTSEESEEDRGADQEVAFEGDSTSGEDSDTTYDEAVKVVLRDKKCSTSYIQRRLGIGYNRAASLVERMEKEGIVGAPNHVGKREILLGRRPDSSDVD
jgi:S-DNA-T family DNA segregation ATPase FtsK/SpoIIIE